MMRPGFSAYPPRPGEPPLPRFVLPPGPGVTHAPHPAPSAAPQPHYAPRDPGVYGRQQHPDPRGSASERAGVRVPLRNAPYSLYQHGGHGDFRDSVQVLSVGGRAGDGVHVVGAGSQVSLASVMHPVMEAGAVASLQAIARPEARDPKRPRMAETHSGHSSHALPPLRIDTRESKEPGYHPQVEAISPTPDDRTTERDDVRSTKEDLLQKISKVDREIAKAESQIAKLKKKQHELEDAANKPSTDSSSEENTPNQSLAQMVYSDNRRKAEESHAALNKLSARNELPLYNQPSDTEQYINNKKNYTVFKKKLVEYFKKAQAERERNENEMVITYSKLAARWNKKVDRIENSRKRKEREAKCREMYEKMFPELRKQREDKERDARLGTRGVVKSDADFEDVIERLQEQENEDKKMHSYAVIPPLLLPSDLIKRKFTNTNGLIPDPMVIYNDRKYVNMWTDQEKEIFKERFLLHPKNFGAIAQYLERKTVADCVQYYYLSKKTENYKQALRKSKIRRPRQTRRPEPAAPPPEVIAPTGLSAGRPVTRNMAHDKTKDDPGASKGSRSGTPNNVKNEEIGDGNEKETGKKKPDRARDAKKVATENQNDSSDDEDTNQAVRSGPHPCVMCKQIVEQSRAVSKAQASQLGLKEEDFSGEVRVCNKCWCNTLKKKHICPVPSCTSSKGGRNRAKLRHLPSKWAELDSRNKETIMAEMQLPDGTKRVCTACFTRITRRISQLDVGSAETAAKVKKEDDESVFWTDAEIETAKSSLKSNGRNWKKMTETVKNKTEEQCKKFFYGQRKRLQLDKLVSEYKKSHSDKPSLTSDEESGSTTSSCEDEQTNEAGESKAGARDIKPPLAPDQTVKTEAEAIKTEAVKKEEGYDSAATVSADESGDHVAGGKPRLPPVSGPSAVSVQQGTPVTTASESISVEAMMDIVISKTLNQDKSNSPSLPTTSSQALSLNRMLNDAPPVPVKRNGGNGGPQPGDQPQVEARPAPTTAPATPASDVLDLTTSRPDRASPCVSGHGQDPPQFSYPGISRPPPEPQPESKGQEPPPAHGGNAKAKTTHNIMMHQDRPECPPMFPRKDTKSPAPVYVGSLGHVRGDPRKELKTSQLHHQNKQRQGPGEPPARAEHRPPSGAQGSIGAGTPRHTPHTAHPRDYQALQSRGSISGPGHPIKPISPRGPPQPGRSNQPTMADPYAKYITPSMNHHQVPPRGGPSDASPSGAPLSSSSSRALIAQNYEMATKMREEGSAQLLPRGHPEPPRGREDPRYAPSPYGSRPPFGPKEGIRGDPRADMPGRGDPRVYAKDPRADLPPRPPLVDALGRPMAYSLEAAAMGSLMPGQPPHSRSSVKPGPSQPQRTPGQGSITQGIPMKSLRDVEIIPNLRQPEVIIERKPQPQAPPVSLVRPSYNDPLSVLADEAANQKRIQASVAAATSRSAEPLPLSVNSRLMDPRHVEAARHKPEPGAPRPGPSTPSEDQKQVMSKLNQMSEAEKIQYYNALKSGQFGNTEHGNMTAALLIEAIITNQINKGTGPAPGPGSRHSPQAMADGKESPSKIPSRSPSVKSLTERDIIEAGVSGSAAIRTSPGTMGEHIENMINKEVTRSTAPSTSVSYPGPLAGTSSAELHEHWKRRGYPQAPGPPPSDPGYSTQQRPPSSTDERQILRVAGPGQERPDKPPSRSSAHEAISPPSAASLYQAHPDPAMARYFAARRKEQETAAAGSSKSGPGFINDDYLKHKITEMMKNEKAGGAGAGAAMFTPADLAAKAMSMGPPHKRPLDAEARGSPSEQPQPESPRKKYKADEAANDAPDSPESGNMVIDETARPDSAHSHKTSSPAPTPPGYRGGQHPRSSPAPAPGPSRPPPANPRYEPLSDDD